MGLISRYLRTLTPEAEDDILTGKMGPGSYLSTYNGVRCLVGTGMGCTGFDGLNNPVGPRPQLFANIRIIFRGRMLATVESRYDDLCYRYSVKLGHAPGIQYANTLIRDAILAARARRMLAQPEPAEVTA